MVFSSFEVGDVSQRRGKGFCEACKPLIGPPFPTVRNTNTTLYLNELIPPSSLLAIGVVPAASWGNSNRSILEEDWGRAVGTPKVNIMRT